MKSIDLFLTSFLNQFVRRSEIFDGLVHVLSVNHLLKGGVLLLILWYVWFKKDQLESDNRIIILITMFACFLSMAIARSSALLLPFRERPINDTAINFLLPSRMKTDLFDGWSSFPSDHAALFYTIALGLFLCSRRAGIAALIYTTFFICLPRLYLGLHFFSDLLAGAIIGVLCAWLLIKKFRAHKLPQRIAGLFYTRPGICYSIFFIIAFEIAEMFESTRHLLSASTKFWELLFL